jgi:hypothetical protein
MSGREYAEVRLVLPDLEALALIREALNAKLTTLNNLALGVRPSARRPDLSGKASATAAVLAVVDLKITEITHGAP